MIFYISTLTSLPSAEQLLTPQQENARGASEPAMMTHAGALANGV